MRHLVIAAASLLLASSALAERVVTHDFVSATPAPGVRTLLIDVPAGGIRVVNGSAGEIRVTGRSKRDFDSWDNRATEQRIVNDVSAETFVKGADAVIRRRFGPNAQSWRTQKFTQIEMTVEVPRGTSVSFDTTAGEIAMNGSFGNIEVDLSAGEIRLTTPRADVRTLDASCRVGEVHTNLGNEIVDREGLFPGRTHFENSAGRTRVKLHVTAGEVNVDLTK